MLLRPSFWIWLMLVCTHLRDSAAGASAISRLRRDLTCAAGGNSWCNWSCKGRGWASGSCAWDLETGSLECVCDKEKRGVRCHVVGPLACHVSCVAVGYLQGVCDPQFRCSCQGGRNAWGRMLDSLHERL